MDLNEIIWSLRKSVHTEESSADDGTLSTTSWRTWGGGRAYGTQRKEAAVR